jgi:hypothetical protein
MESAVDLDRQREPAPRHAYGRELAATMLVSAASWGVMGLGRPGLLTARILLFSLLVGLCIYAAIWIFDRALGSVLRSTSARLAPWLRAVAFFVGGYFGFLAATGLGRLALGVDVGLEGLEWVAVPGLMGVVGMGVALSLSAFGRLKDRLEANVARLKEAEFAEKELELARALQRRLLPPPEVEGEGFRIAARNLPARGVAGDFYDVLPLGDGALLVAVADVAGKGIAASLLVASVKAMLPFLAAGRSAADAVSEVSARLVRELGPREFVALALLRLTPATGEVELANAGLPDPYLLEPGRAACPLSVPGPRLPAGARAGVRYQGLTLRLVPGSRLLLYTDGLPEAAVAGGSPLGYEGLTALLPEEGAAPAAWLDALLDRLRAACPGAAEDDWTALLLERTAPSSPSP